METTNQHKPQEVSGFSEFMRSHTARFIIVGFISLVLLIPLAQIHFLISERQSRQQDVSSEIGRDFGEPIAYHGIILSVPVTETTIHTTKTNTAEKHYAGRTAYILPVSTSETIDSKVTEKHRGIFRVPTFTAHFQTNARFNLAGLRLASNQQADWSKARILLVSNQDTRFAEMQQLTLNGQEYSIDNQETGKDDLLFSSTAPFTINPESTCTISARFAVNGTQSIHYQPFTAKSTLKMVSNWPDPAFGGNSLPQNNQLKISESGFSATWSQLKLNGNRSIVHLDQIPGRSFAFSEVRFIRPVDQYQLNERTVKYGILVLTLTFAVFFLIQVVGKVSIHPLHYFMIGLALVLFYSLLLSFSEQIGFIPAYILASATIVLLIVWYARAVLRSLKFAVMSGLSLTLLYAFLLVIVNLETYALIVGSIGLLIVLAAIMSVTRNIRF